MASKVTLKDLISTLDPQIRSTLLYDTRNLDLNKRPHVLDISKKSLQVNNRDNIIPAFDELYNTFIEVVSKKVATSRTFSSIDKIPGNYFKSSTPYLIYVNNGSLQLLLAMSYDAIQRFISDVVKDPKLAKTAFGVRENKKPEWEGQPVEDWKVTGKVSALDIGHIPSAESAEYFVSPLAQKIATILDNFEVSGVSPNSEAYKLAVNSLNQITSIQAKVDYEFRNSTPEVFQGVEKLFGKMFVAVTVQTSDINQKEFGAEELKIFQAFQEKLAIYLAKPSLVKSYLGLSGSNTILQDIEQAVVDILKTGKSKLKLHAKQKSTKGKQTKIGVSNKLPITSTIKSKIGKSATSGTKPVSTVNLPNLLVFINQHLQDVISANMGDGSRRDILNYRTGRFAGSAKVETLSQSREGMITAFYSYMKNPYATFSEGGRQQRPRTRDPKLLIGTSIKEIAAQQVTNRLRAVLV
jgi:hypothetical protein